MAFGRIWNTVEGSLLKHSGTLFFDYFKECFETSVEVKEHD